MVYTQIVTAAGNTRDIPLIGDTVANIGQVIDIIAAPCQPNAEIWVYALFHSAPALAISLLKPEIIDINIEHRRRKPRKGRGLKFRAADMLFNQLITIPVPRWTVFQLYEWTQRLAWYFLVMDATSEFAVNWVSMAYEWSGCVDVNPPPWMLYEAIPSTVSFTSAEGWHTFNTGGFIDSHGIQPVGGASARFQLLQPCVPLFQLQATTQPFPPGPHARLIAWRVNNDAGAPPLLQAWGQGENTSLGSVDEANAPYVSLPAGTQIWLEYQKSAGFLGISNMRWKMSSARTPIQRGFNPDP